MSIDKLQKARIAEPTPNAVSSDQAPPTGAREQPREREEWVAIESPRDLRARVETIDQLMETGPYGYINADHRFADPSRPPDAVKRAVEQAALAVAESRRNQANRVAAHAVTPTTTTRPAEPVTRPFIGRA